MYVSTLSSKHAKRYKFQQLSFGFPYPCTDQGSKTWTMGSGLMTLFQSLVFCDNNLKHKILSVSCSYPRNTFQTFLKDLYEMFQTCLCHSSRLLRAFVESLSTLDQQYRPNLMSCSSYSPPVLIYPDHIVTVCIAILRSEHQYGVCETITTDMFSDIYPGVCLYSC